MIGSPEIEIPDLVEPITAWRMFHLIKIEDGTYLYSISGTPWPPNGTGKRPFHEVDFVTAQCTKMAASNVFYKNHPEDEPEWARYHPCPSPPGLSAAHAGMGCGIYAFKEPIDLAVEFPLWGMVQKGVILSDPFAIVVWAKVELWGHVYEHAKGYRAEHAKIKSLLWVPGCGLPKDKLSDIAEFYGVNVVRLNLDKQEVERRQLARQAHMAIFEPITIMWAIISGIGSNVLEELVALVAWATKKKEKFFGKDRKAIEGESAGSPGSGPERPNP